MPNQINSKNMPKIITVNDLYNLATLANCDMDWMQVAIEDIRLRVAGIKEDLAKRPPDAEYYFHTLEEVLEMYVYLADNRCRDYAEQAEVYKAEWEANKKAVTL